MNCQKRNALPQETACQTPPSLGRELTTALPSGGAIAQCCESPSLPGDTVQSGAPQKTLSQPRQQNSSIAELLDFNITIYIVFHLNTYVFATEVSILQEDLISF